MGLVSPGQDFGFYPKISEKLLGKSEMIGFVLGRLLSINVIHLINRLKETKSPLHYLIRFKENSDKNQHPKEENTIQQVSWCPHQIDYKRGKKRDSNYVFKN